MRNLFTSLALIISAVTFAQGGKIMNTLSKAEWGVRANYLVNTNSLGKQNKLFMGDLDSHGFNVGISAKADLGKKLFINPELYYNSSITHQIEMPILLGYSILPNKFAIIAGPSIKYAISSDTKDNLTGFAQQTNIPGVKYNGISSMFKAGFQAGFQTYFKNGKYVLSAKYDGAITGQTVNLENISTGKRYEMKEKDNFISIGLGYNFGKSK